MFKAKKKDTRATPTVCSCQLTSTVCSCQLTAVWLVSFFVNFGHILVFLLLTLNR